MTTYERRRNVDKEWFQNKLDERKLSMRALSKLMNVDPSTVSLMVRGMRGLSMDNAVKMADIFNVPTAELYKRAGLPIEDEAREIEIAYYNDHNGYVVEIEKEARDTMSAPYDTPASAFAIQQRSNEYHDGWLIIIDGSKLEPSAGLGSFCLYCRANGSLGIGIIRKGYKAGYYNVTHNVTTANRTEETDVDILWVSPVIWVKPISPI